MRSSIFIRRAQMLFSRRFYPAGCLLLASAWSCQSAEPNNLQAAATSLFVETAETLCGSVPIAGSNTVIRGEAGATTALTGLLKRLAEIGLSIGGSIEQKTYVGVTQEQLSKVLHDDSNCKYNTFRILVENFSPLSRHMGSRNTIVGAPSPTDIGDDNTIIGPNVPNGSTIFNNGGQSIGSGSCADTTSIAIGANALAGTCAAAKANSDARQK